MVQWLRLRASTAGDTDSISGRGTKIPHATLSQKKKKKKCGSHMEKNLWDRFVFKSYPSLLEADPALPISGEAEEEL